MELDIVNLTTAEDDARGITESETGFRPGIDMLLYADELQDGYVVKRELSWSGAKKSEYSTITKFRRYTTNSFTAFGGSITQDNITWVGLYPDGRQESMHSSPQGAWIVSLASIQREEG